jgi:hypothetical protein
MLDVARWITSLPTLAFFLVTLGVGVGAAELGAWLAARRVRKGVKDPEASLGSIIGAMLGLLAFMLGFTFSITASRFSDRKELVVQQANAIGTCYLRTSFLPEKQKLETRRLLHEYVDLLIQERTTTSDVQRDVSKMEDLEMLVWNQTASLGREDMDSELRVLYIASVNEVIDIFSERKTVVLIHRIPGVIWNSLLILFILSMFIVGYQTGLYGMRRIFFTPVMAAAFALVVVLIADMDNITGAHRLRVSQQPLIDVQQMMQQNIP